mgnify:CR=1 FL=1
MKKIIKVVTMILISLSAVAAFPDAAFSKDKPYVSKKLHYAYITAYSDGSFTPYEFITRQEAAVIVCRLTDIASDNVYKKFKDVGADIFQRGVCLPSDNKMTTEQQDRIIEVIRACFE